MIGPRWKKVFRDLWSNKTRTILVVLAIAVGIFTFGSVFITQEILVTDMNTQYSAIRASTITMSIQSFDDSLVRWARRQDEVADAQGRAVYLVKLVEEGKTQNLNLYVYDSYEDMSINRIDPEMGTWPPDRRGLLLERSSFAVAGTEIGDSAVIELSSGRQRELSVSGTVHDMNAWPANMFPQLSGYVSMETLRWLGLPGTYNQLEILTTGEFDNLAKLEKVADEIRERLERNGVSVDSVAVREPGEHWARETTQAFTLILSLIGFFSLLLAGFLVVNTISALLTEQRRQIGMMKAIGGTGGQIISIYLATVTFYGLLSLAVALPVGMWLAYLFTSSVTQFLNIDILNFYLPTRIILLQLIAALLVPVLASAIPVLSGVRVTAREAISSYGVEVKEKGGFLDKLLVQTRGLPRPVLLSLRNTFRRKGRLLLTLGALIIAGALFITVVNVRGSLIAFSDDIFRMFFNYEVELYLDGDYHGQGVVHLAERVPGVTKVEGRTGIQVQRIKPDGTRGATFPIVGVPPDSDFIQPELLSGRWLIQSDRKTIVISSNLADDMLDVQVGDWIVTEIGNDEYKWKVAGVYSNPFDRLSYADFDYLSRVKEKPGLVSSMYVRTEQKDGPSQAGMAEAVEERLKDAGIKVSQWMTKETVAASIAGRFDFLISFLLTMAAMTAVIGGLGLAGMMSLNVMERTREIGVMRSIGATNVMISSLVVTEGIIIGIISWALAIPLSIPMSLAFNALIGQAFLEQGLDFIFVQSGPIVWLVIVVIVSVVASLLPAYRATRMSVRETLAYE
ncbi:MAG: ABC transporter permease [Dehalococcoidia bacterium]|nr:MAG: ABC transporter permease [Dehalococcoidia bacterium]